MWWILVLRHRELAKEVNAKADCSFNFGLEIGWLFRITLSLPEIRVLDGAVGVQWLSIKGKVMVWIDIGEGVSFALVVWKKVIGRIPVVLRVSSFGGALVVLVEWVEPLSAYSGKEGLLWLVRCGLVYWFFASFFFFIYLYCLLLQLVLDFGFVFRSQISSGLLALPSLGYCQEIWWRLGFG